MIRNIVVTDPIANCPYPWSTLLPHRLPFRSPSQLTLRCWASPVNKCVVSTNPEITRSSTDIILLQNCNRGLTSRRWCCKQHQLNTAVTRIATAESATATWPILSGTCTTGTNRNEPEPYLGDVFDIGKNRFLRVRSESLWDSLKWWCLRKWSSGHVVDWAFWEFFPCHITQFLAQKIRKLLIAESVNASA